MNRPTPERVALAKIIFLSSLSLCVLFLLDAGTFRKFYKRYLTPESYAGDFELALRMGREKQFTRQHHVLVMGNSQIAEDFSAHVADEVGAPNWEFVNVGMGAASPRSWYYLLREIDPDRTRFDTIVLPLLTGYADVDNGEILADREFDLHLMIGSIRPSDIPDLMASFVDWDTKLEVLRETLFEGFVYRRDVRDFLRNPGKRSRDLNDCRAACVESNYAYEGRPQDLSGLWVDWTSYTFHFPPGTSQQVQDEMLANCKFWEWKVGGVERAYRKMWMGRIIDWYRGTRTRIVITALPRRPFPVPFSWPIDSGSFIVQVSKNPAVTVLDEHLFDDLQRPEYFVDVYHMNSKGRNLFSRRLAATLIQRLEPHSER